MSRERVCRCEWPSRVGWWSSSRDFVGGCCFLSLSIRPASEYLRELAASDCSPATLRSYAFDLLRWFRFLHRQLTPWERAERLDVRAFVEWLREAPNPQRASVAFM
jgi:hypothetical protein